MSAPLTPGEEQRLRETRRLVYAAIVLLERREYRPARVVLEQAYDRLHNESPPLGEGDY